MAKSNEQVVEEFDEAVTAGAPVRCKGRRSVVSLYWGEGGCSPLAFTTPFLLARQGCLGGKVENERAKRIGACWA